MLIDSAGQRHRLIRSRVLIGALVLAAPVAAIGLAEASIRKPDYEGHFVSDPSARVQVKRLESRGSQPKVRVGVNGLKLFCDGGTTSRVNLEPINAKFTGRKTFEGERYFAGQTKQVLYQVRGRFFSRGRVTGTVLYIDDLINQEEPVMPGDCSTQRRATWRAERVR